MGILRNFPFLWCGSGTVARRAGGGDPDGSSYIEGSLAGIYLLPREWCVGDKV